MVFYKGHIPSQQTREKISKALKGKSKKHGLSYHPLYPIWNAMKQRCTNPNNAGYKYYGERGISVCKRWGSVKNFIDDMSATHWIGADLDRINNNKGYSPNNCRWTTRKVNVCP